MWSSFLGASTLRSERRRFYLIFEGQIINPGVFFPDYSFFYPFGTHLPFLSLRAPKNAAEPPHRSICLSSSLFLPQFKKLVLLLPWRLTLIFRGVAQTICPPRAKLGDRILRFSTGLLVRIKNSPLSSRCRPCDRAIVPSRSRMGTFSFLCFLS